MKERDEKTAPPTKSSIPSGIAWSFHVRVLGPRPSRFDCSETSNEFSMQSLNFPLWTMVPQCAALSLPKRSVDSQLRVRVLPAVRSRVHPRSRAVSCRRSTKHEREATRLQNKLILKCCKWHLIWSERECQRLTLNCWECTFGQNISQVFGCAHISDGDLSDSN